MFNGCSSPLEELGDSVAQLGFVVELTFPDHEHAPTEAAQLGADATVTLHILLEFRFPELAAGLRRSASVLARVSMPEAAMNEDRGSPRAKHDVRPPRDAADVQTEPISE
jgi:hypothetical protein